MGAFFSVDCGAAFFAGGQEMMREALMEFPNCIFGVSSMVWCSEGAKTLGQVIIPSVKLSLYQVVYLILVCILFVLYIYILYIFIYYNIHDIRTNPQIGGQDPKVLVVILVHVIIFVRKIFMLVSHTY